jgi:uncharacterized membrane protein SpoIIM required for sporulation
MSKPWSEFEGFAKALVICVVVMLVSSGLCGVQWFLATQLGNYGGALSGVLIPLGIIELVAIVVSGSAAVVILLAWAARTLYLRISGRNPDEGEQIQTLFPHDDDRP